MGNICTHPGCLFCVVFFPALPYTSHESHVMLIANIRCDFGFVLITYILFPFRFSFLYNLSSFHQCLNFVWHSIEYKLLSKTLLPSSFSQKCSIEWSISNLFLVKTGQKNWCASVAGL